MSSIDEKSEGSLLPLLQVCNDFAQIVMMPSCICITVLPDFSYYFILVFHLYPPKEAPEACISPGRCIPPRRKWIL